jgi:hypothetical protein
MLNEWLISEHCPWNITRDEALADPEHVLDLLAEQMLALADEVDRLRDALDA